MWRSPHKAVVNLQCPAPRDQVVDHLMETRKAQCNKTQSGGDASDADTVSAERSGSPNRGSITPPSWVSKNPPGPKSGRRCRQRGMGACRVLIAPKVPSPTQGSHLPHPWAQLILQNLCPLTLPHRARGPRVSKVMHVHDRGP